ncbi:uncharacterized protein LOC134239500 [Saccostrea cucullata]|uniref:uncharacterized protein LOC134239500 n=1 Tax=Saccostrea cuccullata TaxID=36930 RepID=UPI002ECFB5CB
MKYYCDCMQLPVKEMAESSATVNSGELTVKGTVDWTFSVFEDEDRDFTNTCHRTRNEKSLERHIEENVEDKKTDQPVTLKDAPHLYKGEIENDLVLQNIKELNEPVVKRDRLPDNVTLPTDSGFYSQSEAASDSLDNTLIGNEEQFSTVTDDIENSSNLSLQVQISSNNNEIPIEEILEAKQTTTNQKDACGKVLQLLKPEDSKAISKKLKCNTLFKTIMTEITRFFKQKNCDRSKRLLASILKSARSVKKLISFKNLSTIHVYPLLWMYMQDVPENMRIEWLRVYSLSSFSSQKISSVLLAKHGFYFNKAERKIKCFACDKSYTQEQLENTLDCNAKLQKILHEEWCLIIDDNIPIYQDPANSLEISEGLPSCNKRKYKDELGRIITSNGVCGLNTFFVDQKSMLEQFPAIFDAYQNYSTGDGSDNPFMAILNMLRKGRRNSARGMREILIHTELISASETNIEQFHFELINFVCELMKGKIIVKGKCSCTVERVNKKEQIFIGRCKCHKYSGEFVDGIRIFQHWIDCHFTASCIVCGDQIRWTFPEPPPCLFLKLHHLNFRMEHLPNVIYVLGNRYRLGAIYVHANQHFMVWVSRPGGMAFYDDNNVIKDDKFSARFDDLKEFPGCDKPCLASYYLMP